MKPCRVFSFRGCALRGLAQRSVQPGGRWWGARSTAVPLAGAPRVRG